MASSTSSSATRRWRSSFRASPEPHALDAVEAARELLTETGHGDGTPWVPVGAGVHTGVAYVGTIGEGDALDFTALGDSVNTAARLASSAGVGEILVSAAAASAAELDTTGLEQRTLTLRGRTEVVEAWVTTLGAPSRQEELAPVG
jgi:adenylate cyclase